MVRLETQFCSIQVVLPTRVLMLYLNSGIMRSMKATALAGYVCLSHHMQLAQMATIYTSEERAEIVDETALKKLVKVCACDEMYL
jgi:hypothetical protein